MNNVDQNLHPGLETEDIPFSDESFDGVIAKDILEHLTDPLETCREIHRVMKPGSYAYISVPMAKPSVVWNDYTHKRGFTRKAIGEMV